MFSRNEMFRHLVSFVLSVLATVTTCELARSEDQPQPKSREEASSGGDARNWFERVTRFRHSPTNQRDNSKVKEAFREVVSTSRTYTVRVYADAEQVALGVVVDPDGWILTKASELEGTLTVKLADGRRFPAEVIANRGDLDLAMLRIDATDLPAARWATGDVPEIGNWLATPGPDMTPAAIGIVSGAPRRVRSLRAVLGVILEDNDARVVTVLEGSGAARAGIKPQDLILQVNGKEIDSRAKLVFTISKHRVGEKVRLQVKRGAEELEISAVLTDAAAGVNSDRAQFQNGLGTKLSERRADFPLVFQHDSVLRPLDCGGPLVNLDGEAVGVNIARAGRVASYALPLSVVLPAIAEMKSTIAATAASVERPETDR